MTTMFTHNEIPLVVSHSDFESGKTISECTRGDKFATLDSLAEFMTANPNSKVQSATIIIGSDYPNNDKPNKVGRSYIEKAIAEICKYPIRSLDIQVANVDSNHASYNTLSSGRGLYTVFNNLWKHFINEYNNFPQEDIMVRLCICYSCYDYIDEEFASHFMLSVENGVLIMRVVST